MMAIEKEVLWNIMSIYGDKQHLSLTLDTVFRSHFLSIAIFYLCALWMHKNTKISRSSSLKGVRAICACISALDSDTVESGVLSRKTQMQVGFADILRPWLL